MATSSAAAELPPELLDVPDYNAVDKAIAWFELVFGALFLLVGAGMLVKFWLVRNVFEIKARSPYLVILNGISLLVGLGIVIYLAAFLLFDQLTLNVYHIYTGFYWFLFTFTASWMSRLVRLGVAYCPRIKRRAPWLMSERLLVCTSLVIGVAGMGFPLYKMHTMADGPYAWLFFRESQLEDLWLTQFVLLIMEVFMIPIVWRVDDLFMISWELMAIFVTQFCNTIVNALVDRYGGVETSRWINDQNVPFVAALLMFGLSVINPLRRLAFDPLANSNPTLARAQQRRRMRSLRALKRSLSSGSTEIDLASEISLPQSEGSAVSASTSMNDFSSAVTPRRRRWNYEVLAANPRLASAFRTFAFRALCQESVLFLEEVTKYQRGDFSYMFPCLSEADCNQPAAFLAIVRRFIADGSPDEVNISHGDKKYILELSRRDGEKFHLLLPAQKRLVFGKAYVEVRYILESNLLQRFSDTDEFKDLERTVPRPPTRRRNDIIVISNNRSSSSNNNNSNSNNVQNQSSATVNATSANNDILCADAAGGAPLSCSTAVVNNAPGGHGLEPGINSDRGGQGGGGRVRDAGNVVDGLEAMPQSESVAPWDDDGDGGEGSESESDDGQPWLVLTAEGRQEGMRVTGGGTCSDMRWDGGSSPFEAV